MDHAMGQRFGNAPAILENDLADSGHFSA